MEELNFQADDRADAYSLSSGLAIANHFANTNVNHLRQSANWKTLVTRYVQLNGQTEL